MQDKLELVYSTVRESINYRRGREEQIFAWSAALLVAIPSALMFSEVSPSALIATIYGKVLASALVVFAMIGSCKWQLKQRKLLCGSQVLAAGIMDEMELYDIKSRNAETSVVPTSWRTWGTRNNSFWTQLFQPSKIQCTMILGIFALVVVWSIWPEPPANP